MNKNNSHSNTRHSNSLNTAVLAVQKDQLSAQVYSTPNAVFLGSFEFSILVHYGGALSRCLALDVPSISVLNSNFFQVAIYVCGNPLVVVATVSIHDSYQGCIGVYGKNWKNGKNIKQTQTLMPNPPCQTDTTCHCN